MQKYWHEVDAIRRETSNVLRNEIGTVYSSVRKVRRHKEKGGMAGHSLFMLTFLSTLLLSSLDIPLDSFFASFSFLLSSFSLQSLPPFPSTQARMNTHWRSSDLPHCSSDLEDAFTFTKPKWSQSIALMEWRSFIAYHSSFFFVFRNLSLYINPVMLICTKYLFTIVAQWTTTIVHCFLPFQSPTRSLPGMIVTS